MFSMDRSLPTIHRHQNNMAAHVYIEILIAVIFCFLCLFSFGDVIVDDEFEGVTSFIVEHSFDSGPNPEFTKRSAVTVRSLKGGRAQFSKSPGLSAEEIEKLKGLANENGLYRLRIPLRNPDPSSSLQHVYTAIRACALLESGLSDQLTINVDQAGEIIGVSLVAIPGHCTGHIVHDSQLQQFNSSVEIVLPVNGPAPDTQSYVEKMKKEELEKAKGAQGDNRSFIAKYWMYIVPAFIFMLVASGSDQGGGGGGR